jgi:hypothetical protein
MRKILLTAALAATTAILPLIGAFAGELDLSGAATSGSLVGDVGGTALFSEFATHPAGTGVFDPFLTINSHGNDPIESGYNTDGHTALYLNQQRPEWNTLLRVGDLAQITINNVNYFAFELDSNEPNGFEKDGSAKSLISIDNIRIYTSSTDNTGQVQNDQSKLENPSPLGTLRFALNDPLQVGGAYKIDNWVKLESATDGIADQQGHNGGSGFSDMIVYIPVTDFAGASPTDFVTFYNLNGAHFDADVKGNAAEAGFEEWRAVVGVIPEPNTVALLSLGLVTLGFAAFRRRKVAIAG